MVSYFFSVDFDMLPPDERQVVELLAGSAGAHSGSIAQRIPAPGEHTTAALRQLENLGYVRRDEEGRFVLANFFFRQWLQSRRSALGAADGESTATPGARPGAATANYPAPGAKLGKYELLERIGKRRIRRRLQGPAPRARPHRSDEGLHRRRRVATGSLRARGPHRRQPRSSEHRHCLRFRLRRRRRIPGPGVPHRRGSSRGDRSRPTRRTTGRGLPAAGGDRHGLRPSQWRRPSRSQARQHHGRARRTSQDPRLRPGQGQRGRDTDRRWIRARYGGLPRSRGTHSAAGRRPERHLRFWCSRLRAGERQAALHRRHALGGDGCHSPWPTPAAAGARAWVPGGPRRAC